MEMRVFKEHGWYCFHGSLPWSDEEPPLIGRGVIDEGNYVLVLDAMGGCLLIESAEQIILGGWQLFLPFPTQRAAMIFAAGLGMPTKEDFISAGFEPI